jgi:hypothetical protein
MTRSLAAALLLWCFMAPASAGLISPIGTVAGIIMRADIVPADWQYPQQLPPRFRNHCGYEYFTARPYCSDHCGSNYQFYYCSEASFGCCHLGRGYCDWNGLLRCHP